jgi:C-terminal processing protease CtpA/Prc
VFVLTSARTFSGGEGFALLLQELGRAVVIGERTAGAANAAGRYRVNEYFEAQVSSSTIRTVKSGRNWEGSGVRPDVAVAAADALRVAVEQARR